ncbi:MAG: hypothetical protein CM15mP23_06300 [Cryomorphaceae bacterium]|nr:MAG: hypothetical protein CM15mP23_06300 [Cryomorphaceae bacterium]
MATDLFQAPDYYNMDDLLNEEHKMVRDAARDWVKKSISPIIEDACEKAEFPKQIVSGLGEIGALGLIFPGVWWCGIRSNLLWLNYARIRTGRLWCSVYRLSSIVLSHVSDLQIRN